jgi:hypothetical protein
MKMEIKDTPEKFENPWPTWTSFKNSLSPRGPPGHLLQVVSVRCSSGKCEDGNRRDARKF